MSQVRVLSNSIRSLARGHREPAIFDRIAEALEMVDAFVGGLRQSTETSTTEVVAAPSTPTYFQQAGVDTWEPDLLNGPVQEITLDRLETTIDPVVFSGSPLLAGQDLEIILLRDDDTDDRAVTWDAVYLLPDGFVVGQDPDTQTVLGFRLQPTGNWLCRYAFTNLPI